MAVYCGCGTKANRMRWLIVAILTALGIGLLIGWQVEGGKCLFCTGKGTSRVCKSSGNNFESNADVGAHSHCLECAKPHAWMLTAAPVLIHASPKHSPSMQTVHATHAHAKLTCSFCSADITGCSVGLILFCFFGWIACFIGASVPCYMMCCCGKKPGEVPGKV